MKKIWVLLNWPNSLLERSDAHFQPLQLLAVEAKRLPVAEAPFVGDTTVVTAEARHVNVNAREPEVQIMDLIQNSGLDPVPNRLRVEL